MNTIKIILSYLIFLCSAFIGFYRPCSDAGFWLIRYVKQFKCLQPCFNRTNGTKGTKTHVNEWIVSGPRRWCATHNTLKTETLSTGTKVKIYNTVIYPVVLLDLEAGQLLTLKEIN